MRNTTMNRILECLQLGLKVESTGKQYLLDRVGVFAVKMKSKLKKNNATNQYEIIFM